MPQHRKEEMKSKHIQRDNNCERFYPMSQAGPTQRKEACGEEGLAQRLHVSGDVVLREEREASRGRAKDQSQPCGVTAGPSVPRTFAE